jgi:hypothetical protein
MDQKHAIVGHVCTAMSWLFVTIRPESIPVILSCITSVLGALNYYYSIKNNRKK